MGTKKKVDIAGIESKVILKDQSVGKGRKYTSNFKQDCISYYLTHQDQRSGKIASDLGIPSSTFSGWIKKYKNKEKQTKKVLLNNESNNILLLKSENKKLKDDIEVLKKALAIFIIGVN